MRWRLGRVTGSAIDGVSATRTVGARFALGPTMKRKAGLIAFGGGGGRGIEGEG